MTFVSFVVLSFIFFPCRPCIPWFQFFLRNHTNCVTPGWARLGVAGLNLLCAAPASLPSSSTVPQPPRLTPKQTPPANKVLPVSRDHRLLSHFRA